RICPIDPTNTPASHAGDHRAKPVRDAQFPARGSRGIADPADRESASLGGASPLSPTIFSELKPQKTGTGLLIRFGEVATTSDSTNSLRDGVTSNSALFESAVDGANPSPAANFRPVVKQDHVSPTKRCWGCNSLPGDQLPRCIIRSAPVSDTGGLGAKPGEATTFIYDLRLPIDGLNFISTKNKHRKL